MKYIFLLFFALVIAATARAGQPWIFGTGEAVNLTNGTAFKNGVKNITGSLNPSVVAVDAKSGSMYFSTSGTIYVKQDNGLSTNWLPLGIATTGSLTTINGQSGPNVSIASGTSGSDFAVSASSNVITLNLPTASAIARGALSSGDWALFNSKEPAITSGTTSQYWRGDKTFQTLDKAAVGLGNVDNTSDANKPISTATQSALNLKEDSIATGTTSQYWRGDKSWQTLDKSAVGLSNVDNTSDANKPVSTATQTALNLKEDLANKSTSTSLGTSDTLYPSQKAVKTYVDTGLATKEDAITILPLTKGGTNKNMTAVNGGVVYTDADSQEVSAAGTSGQVLQSNGAAAPTFVNKSISGKANAGSSVTVEELQVPNNLLTPTATNKYLNETGNKNILTNPDFEHSTVSNSWSKFLGTTANTLTSAIMSGSKALQIVHTGQQVDIKQDSALYQDAFADGIQGLAMAWVRNSTTSTPIYFCPRTAGAYPSSLTTQCATLQTDGKWHLYKVPFNLGATSNGVGITSNSVNISGAIDIDDAFVGAVDLKQDINVVGPWQSYTPTFTGFGTPSNIEFQWRQAGENVEIRGKFTAGTTTATEARISLPNSYTSSGTSKIPSLQLAGQGTYTAAAALAAYVLIEPSVAYVTFGIQSSTSAGLSKANGSSVLGTGNGFSIQATIPVTQLSGASSVYSAQCGANCVDTFSAKVSSTDAVTEENIGFINGNCTNATTGRGTCTYDTGIFTVTPNCTLTGNNGEIVYIVSQSSSAITYETRNSAGVAVDYGLTISCQKQGADFIATRNIIGTFNEVVTTPGVTKPVMYEADVTSTGVVTEYGDDWISGNCSASSPFTCTIHTGKFSAIHSCQLTTLDPTTTAAIRHVQMVSKSTTSLVYLTTSQSSSTTTITSYGVSIRCKGQAP